MDDKFDCIVIGGGVAGLAASMMLAKANMKFLLIERGEFAGAKTCQAAFFGVMIWQNLYPITGKKKMAAGSDL